MQLCPRIHTLLWGKLNVYSKRLSSIILRFDGVCFSACLVIVGYKVLVDIILAAHPFKKDFKFQTETGPTHSVKRNKNMMAVLTKTAGKKVTII